MAHFVVTAKKKPRLDTDALEIAIGTRTSCDLTLRDPIAAEVHCRIAYAELAFRIEDAGTATGTFVNGLAIEGPTVLADGDEIVVGVNKLVVRIEREEGALALHLDLQEDRFFQKAKMSSGDDPEWIPGDREAFKEAEINFSEFPALRAVAWGAILVALLFALSLAVPTVRAGLVQPGPLHNLHADAVGAESCDSCHEAFGSVSSALCVNCHAGDLEGRHPFDGSVALALPADACTSCHVEHMGTESTVEEVDLGLDLWSDARPRVRVRDPDFVPPDFREAVGCAGCHESEPTLDDARRRLSDGRAAPSPEETAAAVQKFDHSTHVGARDIACARCHAPGDREDGRDFAVVPFTTCMSCHHAEGNTAYDLADIEVDAEWVELAPAFELAYHGRDEAACARCHQTPGEGDLRRVTTDAWAFFDSVTGEALEDGALLFSYASRGHTEQAAAKGKACSECHASGELVTADRTDRRFWHGLHLRELTSESCAECHADVSGSSSLTGASYSEQSCARCHASAGNDASVPKLAPSARRIERERVDFPHDAHVGSRSPLLAAGCASCHVLSEVSDGFQASVTTPPEVASCVACHSDHANVGGGDTCQKCHAQDDPLFATARATPAASRRSFNHFQAGHVANLRDCGSCHGGVEEAQRISDISLPDLSAPGCFECHFETRFHWR